MVAPLARACAAQVVVSLRPHALVPAADFRLADVAEIEAQDESAAQALKQLTVGHAGDGVGALSLTRSELERYVSRHLPAGVAEVQWQGAERVSVQLQTQAIDPEALVQRAAQALRETLEKRFAQVELRAVGRVEAVRVPLGEAVLQARLPVESQPQPSRRMRVYVDVLSGGRLWRTVPVGFEVRAWAEGWVARRDLPAAHLLESGDLERAPVDIAALGAMPAGAEGWAGQRLHKPVKAGAPLSVATVEPVPMVQSQQAVTVESRAGEVVIESQGIALGEGREGDLVPVRTQGTQLRARVVGPKRVAL